MLHNVISVFSFEFSYWFFLSYHLRMQVAANTCSRWFLARGFFYPEDGGDTFLRNVGSHKIYTAPHPRRRHSSTNKYFTFVVGF
jgi:hypothetical protein